MDANLTLTNEHGTIELEEIDSMDAIGEEGAPYFSVYIDDMKVVEAIPASELLLMSALFEALNRDEAIKAYLRSRTAVD